MRPRVARLAVGTSSSGSPPSRRSPRGRGSPSSPSSARTPSALLAIGVAPACVISSCGLVGLTAFACRAPNSRTPQGEFSIHGLAPEVVRWAKYNAAAHVVRVICGELFRATPVWRWYLQAMGADIGRGVHVNTAALYDINLVETGDHAVVGGRAKLGAHLVEDGILEARPVVSEERVTVGTGSIVSPGVHVEAGGQTGALSFVTKDTCIPAGEACGGGFARPLERRAPGAPAEPPAEGEALCREPGPETGEAGPGPAPPDG